MFLRLALKSLLNRKGSVFLTLMAMTVSVFVLFSVEHLRHQTKEGFANTVSGVDLVVGARTGSLNLLLYSVFRIGAPTNNISWDVYQYVASSRHVKWAIPISLGDSHKGYRVMGTTRDYFEFFSYGKKHRLGFEKGDVFNNLFDVVIGSAVAKKLGYSLGEKLVLSHGVAKTSFSLHDDRPFTVVGILKPTGTPVDQTLHVSLGGVEAIHIDWKNGVKITGSSITPDHIESLELAPKSITAFMLGLNSRMTTFKVQRSINNYEKAPMLAILPGVALSELWQMMGILENALLFVAALVFIAALLGLSAMLLSSIQNRASEIHLLRVVGAPPSFLFFLIELEALLITTVSLCLGSGLLIAFLLITQDFLLSNFGLHVSSNIFSPSTLCFALGIICAAVIVTAIPSFRAYRQAKRV